MSELTQITLLNRNGAKYFLARQNSLIVDKLTLLAQ
ncbi:Uncharacterised protein [Shewanella putrefaciens]|nr:Uncharacterised protein [Shewanella putrefaciens]